MRLTGGLALALWLSLPVAGTAFGPQEPAGANASGPAQAPPASKENVPVEQAPAENPPASEKKAPESVAKGKSAASPSVGSASTATKRRKRTAPTTTPAPVPDGGPRKVVVHEGGASEPTAQIVPGMTSAEATRQRQNAERLLSSTDDQLKQLAVGTLGAQQQETVGQIRNYMEGARSALKEGDVRRASTLAEKAHLLAKDLVKH